jgi:hypothetical protein
MKKRLYIKRLIPILRILVYSSGKEFFKGGKTYGIDT